MLCGILLCFVAMLAPAIGQADTGFRDQNECANTSPNFTEINRREPTVFGKPNFSASQDAAALRTVTRECCTDKRAILELLVSRDNEQRQQIVEKFGSDIFAVLTERLSDDTDFRDCMLAMLRPPAEFLSRELKFAMEGGGTNEDILIEILCTRTKREMADIVLKYKALYGRSLVEEVCTETSGEFAQLLTLLIDGVRTEGYPMDPDVARADARAIFHSVQSETDDDVFNRVLARESFAGLRLIFEEYKNISGRTIEQAITARTGGYHMEALLAIVEYVQSPAGYYARVLRRAMAGGGTDENALIRVIVSRSEIDLGTIKAEYERLYDMTLLSDVKEETAGDDLELALEALIGPSRRPTYLNK